tara:strand:- start:1194 stop:1565 length:372 start_codon:yes stop_codon:yes gene_type:complete
MIKSFLSVAAASALTVPSAFAGVYVNVENNGSFTGKDFTTATTDFHVGYEGEAGALGYYVQGGPAVIRPDGVDGDTRISGKVGGNFAATEKLDVYGEFSVLTADSDTDDDNSYGTKIGVKYSF